MRKIFILMIAVLISCSTENIAPKKTPTPTPDPTPKYGKIYHGSGKTTNDASYYKKYNAGRIASDTLLQTYADSRNSVPQKGLIVWYPFSATSTTTAYDSVSQSTVFVTTDSSRNQYDYTGILNGNVTTFTDRFANDGSAFDFANQGYVTVNSSGNNFLDTLGNPTGEATVSAWIYLPAGSPGGAIVDNNKDATDDAGYTLIFDNDTTKTRLDAQFGKKVWPAGFYAQIGSSSDTVHNTVTHKYGEILYDVEGSDTTFWNKTYDNAGLATLSPLGYNPKPTPINTWIHVAFTYDHGVGTLYVNGKVIASKTGMNPIAQNRDKLFIGKPVWFGSVTFQGGIDDVAMWNRVLTSDEILGLQK